MQGDVKSIDVVSNEKKNVKVRLCGEAIVLHGDALKLYCEAISLHGDGLRR